MTKLFSTEGMDVIQTVKDTINGLNGFTGLVTLLIPVSYTHLTLPTILLV